jgi:hypothetical protein
MPRGPRADPLAAALATAKSPADVRNRERLRQRVHANVGRVAAEFARRGDEADAVGAHVRQRHRRARAGAISGHRAHYDGVIGSPKQKAPRDDGAEGRAAMLGLSRGAGVLSMAKALRSLPELGLGVCGGDAETKIITQPPVACEAIVEYPSDLFAVVGFKVGQHVIGLAVIDGIRPIARHCVRVGDHAHIKAARVQVPRNLHITPAFVGPVSTCDRPAPCLPAVLRDVIELGLGELGALALQIPQLSERLGPCGSACQQGPRDQKWFHCSPHNYRHDRRDRPSHAGARSEASFS